MNILYEDSMPYAEHFFAHLGHCRAFSSGTILAVDLDNIDVLLVRSTTKVNESLIHRADKLKYVATATAGSDHLDKHYLNQRNIPWGSAAGCNAIAVAEYVLSCLMVEHQDNLHELFNKTVGIVGAGHVGTQLQKRLATTGIKTKLCDPPLEAKGDPRQMVSLDEVCQCDIISLHVPFVNEGPWPTLHMFDASRLDRLDENQLLINACRGEVVDNKALLALLKSGAKRNVVLDVWENEPNIDFELAGKVNLATAHIAGHSLEGKARGTYMLYEQLCSRFGLAKTLSFESCLPKPPEIDISSQNITSNEQLICAAVLNTYNVRIDSDRFIQDVNSADKFVYSRKHYAIRREFAHVKLNAGNHSLSEAIYGLGFNTP
ncbi:4-phosphoerythronate dehydrogenase [Aliiglaciecola sp. M165]|uniref:4-phosphoerythronate dehydrogenase n=1 Tax=Aliiglaciecola sp. M165 TaxID=2593649 RepID=UPI00117CA82F|nr:4-phosphoerythronate dehydrogenase [Aliiglaciecola sp. M165]TRY29398.1 4-phosphoerythronate dehydrogenase [Aliiglaciecola sp. M165]